MTSTSFESFCRKSIFVIAWLLLWQGLTALVNNKILLAGPVDTAVALIGLIQSTSFWMSVLMSLAFITGGFFIGIILGTLLALFSYRSRLVADFFAPFVGLLKAIPVASFVVIIMVWAGNKMLSLIISSIVVFPVIYLNILEGLRATDRKLLEMARVFKLPRRRLITNIYLPQLKPFILSSFSLACGMSWKSGIAAELISQPIMTIGNGLYRSRIFLMTADMFAWTFVAILMAYLSERIIMSLVRRLLG